MKNKGKILTIILIAIIILLAIVLYRFSKVEDKPNKNNNTPNYIESLHDESVNVDAYFPINANILTDYSGTSSNKIDGTENYETVELILFDNNEFVLIYDSISEKLIKIGNYVSNNDGIVLHILYKTNECKVEKIEEEDMTIYKNLDETIFINGNYTKEIIKANKLDDVSSVDKQKYSCLG